MPVRIPAFLMRSGSVLPICIFVFLFCWRQNGGVQPPRTRRRRCKKTQFEFFNTSGHAFPSRRADARKGIDEDILDHTVPLGGGMNTVVAYERLEGVSVKKFSAQIKERQ